MGFEAETAIRLVRDLCLQRFPCALAVIETGSAPNPQLATLDPYLIRRLRWPEDAALLTTLAKEMGRGRHFTFARVLTRTSFWYTFYTKWTSSSTQRSHAPI